MILYFHNEDIVFIIIFFVKKPHLYAHVYFIFQLFACDYNDYSFNDLLRHIIHNDFTPIKHSGQLIYIDAFYNDMLLTC